MSNPYNSDGKAVYFTAWAAVQRDDMRPDLFVQYVEKKYGPQHHGQAYCAGGNDTYNAVVQARDRAIEYAKAHGSTVVMTDWTPDKHEALMAEAAKNPAPRPSSPALAAKAAPPPSAAQTAYEKALEAQRPHSVTQTQMAASAPTPATPAKSVATVAPYGSTASERYTFCYSTGSPSRGTTQSHYYVTQLFPAPSGNTHPYDAFTAYLKGQHRQESITGGTCSTPGPRNREESTRQSYIEGQRKFANRAVVELDWKPAD